MMSGVAIVVLVMAVGIACLGLAAVITSERCRRFDAAREQALMQRQAAERSEQARGLAREPIRRTALDEAAIAVADGRWARGQRVWAR